MLHAQVDGSVKRKKESYSNNEKSSLFCMTKELRFGSRVSEEQESYSQYLKSNNNGKYNSFKLKRSRSVYLRFTLFISFDLIFTTNELESIISILLMLNLRF